MLKHTHLHGFCCK